jgi:hypothetical protein
VTKFNLSIGLFTQDVRDAVDVAQVLRGVADRLAKFTTQPWSTYALEGKIYSREGKRIIGTWSVDPETTAGLTITAQSDPDSRVHCSRCGQHIRTPEATQDTCDTCAPEGTLP